MGCLFLERTSAFHTICQTYRWKRYLFPVNPATRNHGLGRWSKLRNITIRMAQLKRSPLNTELYVDIILRCAIRTPIHFRVRREVEAKTPHTRILRRYISPWEKAVLIFEIGYQNVKVCVRASKYAGDRCLRNVVVKNRYLKGEYWDLEPRPWRIIQKGKQEKTCPFWRIH